MQAVKKLTALAATVVVFVAIPASSGAATGPDDPPQIVWAERLVHEVAPEQNVYGSHPTIVRWVEDGKGSAVNRSVCSSFVTQVLERAYGFDHAVIRSWFGKGAPRAIDYARAIVARRGFEPVGTVAEIRSGDLIAIAYPPGSGPTGHIMIADGTAVARVATAPFEAGLRQYEIVVIDSSQSWHGYADTRARVGLSQTGVGRGMLRLYVAPDGTIRGYSWSTRSDSRFYSDGQRRLVVGHLTTPPSDRITAGDDGNDDARGGDAER